MAAREQMGTTIDRGIIDRVAAGIRYAITGVGPDNWFGPQQPLAPIAQDKVEGRQFDYPVGYNLRITPRSEELISFPMLRGLADGYDLMRLVIETRKDQIGGYEWEIVPKDPDADPKAMQGKIREAMLFLEKPDRENDWTEWLRLIIEDLLVIDTICVYPRQNRGGKLYGLELVDGGTIKRLIDEDGRTPLAPSPAYQQILKGIPAADYTMEDLIYMVRNKRTWKLYGYSPVEQVIMTVNIALRRQMHQLEFYTAGNIPEAIAQLPKDWPAQTVKDFQLWWDSLMEGNTAQRRKMKFIPNLEGILFPKAELIKDEYDEWLARITCFAFSISPTAFVKQNNRATAEQAADTAKEEGLVPLLNWLQAKMSQLVQGPMGYPDLAFHWKIKNKTDPLAQAQTDQIYIQAKVVTADEIREDLGKEPLTEEQKAEIAAATPPPANTFGSYLPSGSGQQSQQQKPAFGQKPGNENKPNAEQAKLAKAQRKVTAVKRYVDQAQPDLQNAIAAILAKHAKEIANKIRKSKLLGKADPTDQADSSDPLVAQIIAQLNASGVAAAIVAKVAPEMVKAFTSAGIKGVIQVSMDASPSIVSHMDEAARAYAADRSALLVKGIEDTTLSDLRTALTAGIEQGMSADELADQIEGMGTFGEARAAVIARTELAFAHVQGNVTGWRQSGEVVGKRSILGDLHKVEDECDDCADAGVVGMEDEFIPGYDFPPYHPNCVCDIVPVLSNSNEEQ